MKKRLEAVVEIYGLKNFTAWKSVKNSQHFIRLWENTTLEETGSVIAQIARYNRIEINNKKETIVDLLLTEDTLVVSGGLKTVEDNKKIYPSCCCGLEGWNEWLHLTPEKTEIWLGHDPSPFIEFDNETKTYRVWSDGGLNENTTEGFHIDFTIEEMRRALNYVSQDLRNFTFVLQSWGQNIVSARANELVNKFKKHFHVE